MDITTTAYEAWSQMEKHGTPEIHFEWGGRQVSGLLVGVSRNLGGRTAEHDHVDLRVHPYGESEIRTFPLPKTRTVILKKLVKENHAK